MKIVNKPICENRLKLMDLSGGDVFMFSPITKDGAVFIKVYGKSDTCVKLSSGQICKFDKGEKVVLFKDATLEMTQS